MASDANTVSGNDSDAPPALFSCGSYAHHQQLLQSDPQYKNARSVMDSITDALTGSPNLGTDTIRIPVVFHIVWHEDEEKVSFEQINSQIDALNRDFNLKNGDVADVPEVWKDVVANPNITFFRTRRDPAGKPHQGVNYVKTKIRQFKEGSENMKFTKNGGADIWDSTRFLNIWVCNIENLLGRAQFPTAGASPETDGVIINYTAFGTMGTTKAPYNLGRTAVHEVGHWLNLHHIWGDGSDADTTEFVDDDGVDDTPRCDDKNFGKPFFPSVSNTAKVHNGPNGDMFMNYMDYSDDDTTVMFTKGQVMRMRITLATVRSTLYWSHFTTGFPVETIGLQIGDGANKFYILDWNNDPDTKSVDILQIRSPNSQETPQHLEVNVISKRGGAWQKPLPVETGLAIDHKIDYCHFFGRFTKENEKAEIDSKRYSLISIKRREGADGHMALEAYSGISSFQTLSCQVTTPLPALDRTWSLVTVDWQHRGLDDLVAIRKSGSINKKVEVHILAANGEKRVFNQATKKFEMVHANYEQWLGHFYTALDEVGDNVEFLFTDWNGDGTWDLVAITKSFSDTARTHIDILSGASRYREYLVQTDINLFNIKNVYDFCMTDWTGDGRPDLIAIQKEGWIGQNVQLKAFAG